MFGGMSHHVFQPVLPLLVKQICYVWRHVALYRTLQMAAEGRTLIRRHAWHFSPAHTDRWNQSGQAMAENLKVSTSKWGGDHLDRYRLKFPTSSSGDIPVRLRKVHNDGTRNCCPRKPGQNPIGFPAMDSGAVNALLNDFPKLTYHTSPLLVSRRRSRITNLVLAMLRAIQFPGDQKPQSKEEEEEVPQSRPKRDVKPPERFAGMVPTEHADQYILLAQHKRELTSSDSSNSIASSATMGSSHSVFSESVADSVVEADKGQLTSSDLSNSIASSATTGSSHSTFSESVANSVVEADDFMLRRSLPEQITEVLNIQLFDFLLHQCLLPDNEETTAMSLDKGAKTDTVPADGHAKYDLRLEHQTRKIPTNPMGIDGESVKSQDDGGLILREYTGGRWVVRDDAVALFETKRALLPLKEDHQLDDNSVKGKELLAQSFGEAVSAFADEGKIRGEGRPSPGLCDRNFQCLLSSLRIRFRLPLPRVPVCQHQEEGRSQA
ncbi:uncharacterized protein E0L32_004548 [Thyridium curvatum]|uniref:Uncharacterized protein n=1 Tax=Thyridium curvatum TaxID=1093900 RepID=A0A507BE95_9PEZI|nr:uncharacterized protein E0L32_004548 [Thyridium curvatum]TPX15271.1 hypothetical protein E0L32_004548 [Thyridium curvatum]